MGWPDGFQKMGVTTTGPVDGVPIIGPPCQIKGGVPLAASLVITQPPSTRWARITPLKWPERGWPVALQAEACVEDADADPAEITAVSRPNANRARIAPRPRPECACFIF